MSERSILLLAADSGEGPLGDFLDPVVREAWRERGFRVCASYVSDLRRELLDCCHVVVLLRTPIPGHPVDDHAAFVEKSAWLREYVKAGGGLLVLFTENYGKTESTLNELVAPWGLRLHFNRLVARPGTPVDRFPRFHESVILPATFAAHPLTGLRGELGLICEGGHGTQHLTCVGDARWQPLLRGGPHLRSEPYQGSYPNSSEQSIADPVLAAAAEVGSGRVVAFPGSAPFWLVNPFIWRFGGHLHTQRGGAGARFLEDALAWLADTERGRALPAGAADRAAGLADPARLLKPELCSFQRVGETQQAALRRAEPQRIWMGPHPGTDLAAWAKSHPGCRALFPLCPHHQLDEDRWPAYRDAGRAASTADVQVMPGYDLLDDEGVRSAVVSPEVFPKHVLRYPNSTLLENVWLPVPDCLSVLRTPLENRIPPQRYGGYNLIEWDPAEAWARLYRQLVASKYFIAPIALADTPGGEGAQTWVLVPPGARAVDQLRRNRHATFVTSGPRLETFAWEGPGLTDDDWEGYWYGYRPGDEAVVHLRVAAGAPLHEVVLYDGEEVLRTFCPDSPDFAVRLRLTLWRDRSLHVTARDAAGGRLYATFPLYTRNLDFWGHVGSDQMNNYVNAMAPSPRGFLGVRGEPVDMFGFVTLGAGWGDYLRITPSIRYSDFMPRQEISLVIGSFNLHHPSALLGSGPGQRYLNDHRRVFSFCGADAQWFRGTVAGQHLDNADGLVQVWHGRAVKPTRLFLPVPGAEGEDEYVVWRWTPGAPILVEVRKQFRIDPALLAGEWLTFASNAHHLLPGLSVRAPEGASLAAAQVPASPVRIDPHKEWDNSHYLRNGPSESLLLDLPGAGDIEIGHGGAGTFGLFPLGVARAYRCALQRTARELNVFFQCRLTDGERRGGEFGIAYLLAVDATETPGTPFDALREHLARAGLGARRFSVPLPLPDPLPQQVDLDLAFPALRGRPLWLDVRGLPAGTTCWQDDEGRTCFASQPQQGRSLHYLGPADRRRYRLVTRAPLEVES
jgi:hypothetical protein